MYQLIIAWDDCACKTEHTDDICAALSAMAIYLADPHTVDAHIWDCRNSCDVFNWSR